MPRSAGRVYYDAKVAAGKTEKEARRCLKRRLADHIWRLMIRDERHRTAGPGGQQGAPLQSSAAGSTPRASSSDKSLPKPATPTLRPAKQPLANTEEPWGNILIGVRRFWPLSFWPLNGILRTSCGQVAATLVQVTTTDLQPEVLPTMQ